MSATRRRSRQTSLVSRSNREILRQDAYAEPSKLSARQRLWSYVDRTWDTGRIYSVLDLAGSETIVDIGCGNGRDLIAARSDGHTGPIVGIDFSLGMLNSVPDTVAIRVNGDALQIPLATDSADVVCAMHMLYHVDDISAALEEAKRVMRPNGSFLCSTNSEHAIPELAKPWSDAMEAVGGPSLQRQSHTRFCIESGEPLLRRAFSSVELHPSEVVARVPDAEVIRNYVASTADLYKPTLPDPRRWDDVLERVHRHATEVISQHGTFNITQRAGIFVCR